MTSKDWHYEPAQDHELATNERMKSLCRECGLLETTARLGWYSAMRVYLKVMHRLTVQGRQHLPQKPPFVMICNHASHLDTMVLQSVLPRRLWDTTFPLAAGDTFFNSAATALLSAGVLNALPMWRRRRSARHAIEELRQRMMCEPCGYILFPEGTRTRNGKLGNFKPGIGMLVAELDVPVIPCYLDGAYRAWPHRKLCPRLEKLDLQIGSPLRFPTVATDRPGWDSIARTCMSSVAALSPS